MPTGGISPEALVKEIDSMKIVKRGEADTSTRVNLDDKIVTVVHVTAHDSLNEKEGFLHSTKFDFSQCSEEQILTLAAESATIKARVKYAMKSCEPEKMTTEVNVADMLKGTRSKISSTTKKIKAAADALGMTPEEMLAKLSS